LSNVQEFTDSVEGPAAPEDSPEKDSGPWTGGNRGSRDGGSVDSGLNNVARGSSPLNGDVSVGSVAGNGGRRRNSGFDDARQPAGGSVSPSAAGHDGGGIRSALSDDTGPTVQQDGKHSLLQFALLHFRDGDK
jgi:hypothetical protein